MPNVANGVAGRGRTVQEYIDERPMWPDGTHLSSVPMTKMQRRIWMLAAAGKFFEGVIVFMTGVALPLIAREFNITPAENGFVSAASLSGILIGVIALGSLSDRFGRKSMFIVEMIIFTAFLADRVGRIRLQVFGFIGCAVGLFLASLSVDFKGAAQMAFIFAGFMLFNFMTNLGPNAQTYLLAGEVFPTAIRERVQGSRRRSQRSAPSQRHFCFPFCWPRLGHAGCSMD
jgi:MFS family permease